MDEQNTHDRLDVELASFKMRNAQRSLPDYTLSTETSFTPRPRYQSPSDNVTSISRDGQNPVLAALIDQSENSESSSSSSSENEIRDLDSAHRDLYAEEIRVSKIAAFVSLFSAVLAVIVAVVTFVVTATTTFDASGFVSQTISLIALIVIAWLAFRSSQRSKENARALVVAH